MTIELRPLTAADATAHCAGEDERHLATSVSRAHRTGDRGAAPDLYVSGHAGLTAPAVETIRRMLGENTVLTLHSFSTNADPPYATLSEIEYDAFHARIGGGFHFRDAMEDGYYIGHTVSRRVLH